MGRLKSEELKTRTKAFGLRVIRLIEALPRSQAAAMITRQLLRSATAVGANYRAASRAQSRADFVAKIADVEEEADESGYWLEMLLDAGIVTGVEVSQLLKEANELTAIFTASGRTARRGQK